MGITDDPNDPWYIIEIRNLGDSLRWFKWGEGENLSLAESHLALLQTRKSLDVPGELFIFKRSYVVKQVFGYGEWNE